MQTVPDNQPSVVRVETNAGGAQDSPVGIYNVYWPTPGDPTTETGIRIDLRAQKAEAAILAIVIDRLRVRGGPASAITGLTNLINALK